MEIFICPDCALLFANGETPPEMDENATAEWLAVIENRTSSWGTIVLGDSDEDREFSWSPCPPCGSGLGGYRYHAVVLDVA